MEDIYFEDEISKSFKGLVVFFDLEGFSNFMMQPDIELYVLKYINFVFKEIYSVLGDDYLEDFEPIEWKFLGDGTMIIWDIE